MTEGQFINAVRGFLGLEPLYHEKRKGIRKMVSDDTKLRVTVHTVRKKVEAIRQMSDDEVAFSTEINLMKDYIRQRASLGDKTAAEIMTSWEIQFKRYCA